MEKETRQQIILLIDFTLAFIIIIGDEAFLMDGVLSFADHVAFFEQCKKNEMMQTGFGRAFYLNGSWVEKHELLTKKHFVMCKIKITEDMCNVFGTCHVLICD
jgi:hypothetical protein